MSPLKGGRNERYALPPRGGKRPSQTRLGAFAHPRRWAMLAPLSKRRYASVLPDSPPLGALPPDKSAPPITV